MLESYQGNFGYAKAAHQKPTLPWSCVRAAGDTGASSIPATVGLYKRSSDEARVAAYACFRSTTWPRGFNHRCINGL